MKQATARALVGLAVAVSWGDLAWGQKATATVDERQRFPLDRLRMALDSDGSVNVESGRLPARYSWDMLFWLGTVNDPLVLTRRSATGDDERLGSLVAQRVDGALGAAVVLFDSLQIGVDLPVIMYQTRDSQIEGVTTTLPKISGFGLGDLRIVPKLRVLTEARHHVDLALLAGATLPTGTNRNYFVEGSASLLPGIALSRHFASGLRVLGNAIYRVREDQQLLDLRVADELEFRLGAAYRFDARGTLPLEIASAVLLGTSAASPFAAASQDPAEGILQAAYTFTDQGVVVFAGFGTGLREGFGVPDWRVYVGLRPFDRDRDRDGDGLLDSVDTCPLEPEDRDGFQDSDGCVDPDNDGDGILDRRDACPEVAEDLDGFQDSDGCVDPDNDGDGILDAKDRCPNRAEDRDHFEDSDGCPDPDNDGDGVPDLADRCPLVAEDFDGFEDSDGCVDPDNDGDGVPDLADRCPLDAGTKNLAGCVDVAAPALLRKITLIGKVNFETNRAVLLPVSFPVLDEVVSVLAEHPEFERVRVEGHTDGKGSLKKNMRLSQARAESVRTYLIQKGIEPVRLLASGYGPTRPVASNKSVLGREQNRRVEFAVLENEVPEEALRGKPSGIRVVAVRGATRAQGAKATALQHGVELEDRDVLIVDAKGEVDLRGSGGEVKLGGPARVSIASRGLPRAKLVLESGKANISAQAPFALGTLAGDLEITGKDVGVDIDKERRARVSVREGEAIVRANRKEFKIPRGHRVILSLGAHGPVLPLPPAPSAAPHARVTRVSLGSEAVQHRVAWSKVPTASRYVVSRSHGGLTSTVEIPGTTTELAFSSLAVGGHAVEVASVDADGFTGPAGKVAEIAVVTLAPSIGVSTLGDHLWDAVPGGTLSRPEEVEMFWDEVRMSDRSLRLIGQGTHRLAVQKAGFAPDVIRVDLGRPVLRARVEPQGLKPEGETVAIAIEARSGAKALPLEGARITSNLGGVTATATATGATASLRVPATRRERHIPFQLVLAGEAAPSATVLATQIPAEAMSLSARRVPLHAHSTSLDLPLPSPFVAQRLRLSSAIHTDDGSTLDQRGRLDGQIALPVGSRLGFDAGGSVSRLVPPDPNQEAEVNLAAQGTLRAWLLGDNRGEKSHLVVASLGYLQGFRDTREGKAPTRVLPTIDLALSRGRFALATSQGGEIELRARNASGYRGTFRGAFSLDRRVAVSAQAILRAGTPITGGGTAFGSLLGAGVHVGRDMFTVSISAHLPTDDDAQGWFGAYALTLGLDWFSF